MVGEGGGEQRGPPGAGRGLGCIESESVYVPRSGILTAGLHRPGRGAARERG